MKSRVVVQDVLVCLCTLAGAALPTPDRVLAQETGEVTGQILSEDTEQPLPGVVVRVRGTQRGAVSDGDGRFTIRGVPSGSRVLEISVMGYRSESLAVDVPPGAPAQVEISLVSRPLEVGGIQVSVLRPDLQPRAELTEREVRRANPKDAGELLRELGGVDAVRRGPLGLDPVVRGLRETEVGTYLDGTRLFPAGPARMDPPLTHLDPSAVRGMEVVKGPYALTWGAGNLAAIRLETPTSTPASSTDPSRLARAAWASGLTAPGGRAETIVRVGASGSLVTSVRWKEGASWPWTWVRTPAFCWERAIRTRVPWTIRAVS